MEADESKSQSQGHDSQIMPENVEGFQQCVKEILNLIEQDEDFSEMTPEIYNSKKSKLTKLVKELWRMHGASADQHLHLIKEVIKNTNKFTTPIKTEHVGSSSSTSHQVNQTNKTPEFTTPVGFDVTFTHGGGFHLNPPVNNDASKVNKTTVHDHGTDMLLEKISTLKKENVQDENAILGAEKANVPELKETISKANRRIETMENVLEGCRNQLKEADEVNSKLQHDLSGKIFNLTEKMSSVRKKFEEEQAQKLELYEKVVLGLAESAKRDEQIAELNAQINLLKNSHAAEEERLNADIQRLKTELMEKCELVDELNLKHDTLMSFTMDKKIGR